MAEGAGEGRRGQMRQRILAELCGQRRTTGELAQKLGISATAVRDHLGILEGDRLVGYVIERRGPGKPKHVYELTDAGQLQLSRAYLPVLDAVVAALEKQSGASGLESVLRDAGRALATADAGRGEGLRERVDAGAAALIGLGAAADVVGRQDGEEFSIEGRCCPLGSLSPRAPLVCKLFEAMLEEITGASVRERCDREAPPHCRFDIR